MDRRGRIPGVCLGRPAVLAGLLWAGAALVQAGTLRHGDAPPAGLGGPLDLMDSQGRRFGLGQVAGRPVLLFFGFTHCGSTCPMALLTAAQVLASTPRSLQPAVLFVTLDPLSDGPRELAAYLGAIDARIVGLTGHPDQVEQAAGRYGVAVRPRPGGTGLDHSSRWYLLDIHGRLRRVYRHDTPATHLLEDLRILALP
jgi:protein SCO1/2